MHLIQNISREEKILKASYDDLITFGKVFLYGDFKKSETPEFHYEVADMLLRKTHKPGGIFLPRGSSKTTLIKAKILHDFLFSHKAYEWGFADQENIYFDGWASSSQRKSVNNIRYLRLHLQHNKRMKRFFGSEAMALATMNQEDLMLKNGNRILSSSNLTSIRGDTQADIEKGALRYFNVFVDDAENEENTNTINGRTKIVDNIMNGILPAIDQNIPGARLFMLQTPVHHASFAQYHMTEWSKIVNTPYKIWLKPEDRPEPSREMKEYPWEIICYESEQPYLPGGVLWNSYYPMEKLDRIRNTYVKSPRGIRGYEQEYRLNVQSEEHSNWTEEHLRYWDGHIIVEENKSYVVIDGVKEECFTFIGCDPATDIDTFASDSTSIVLIGVTWDGSVFVETYVHKRSLKLIGLRDGNDKLLSEKGIVDYLIELSMQYASLNMTIEDVGMNRGVFQQLNDRMRTKDLFGKIIPLSEKPAGRRKAERIRGQLDSRFASRMIYIKRWMHDLKHQILTFGPQMAHDDLIEGLSLAVTNSRKPGAGTRKKVESRKKRKKKSWYMM